MSISALPPAPSRSQTEDDFIATADPFLAALGPMVTQINVTTAGLNNLAAGGAMALPYTFSTTTTDSDPGAGVLRLNLATQNTVTVIRTDLLGADGNTWTSVIDTFDDSNSAIKGYIRLSKTTDPTKFLIFSVSSLASPSGYKNITVVNVASSSANPFANGDSLILSFTRNGDIGSGVPALVFLGSVTAASSATVDIETTIDATYDNYVIIADDVTFSTSAVLRAQYKLAGAYDTATNYRSSLNASNTTSYTGSTAIGVASFALSPTLSSTDVCNFHMDLFHPAGTTLNKLFKTRGVTNNSGNASCMDAAGYHTASTGAVTGIRFFPSTGTIATGTFRLYGIRNS